MLLVKTPQNYLAKANLLQNAGEHIRKWGKKAYIIGGKTATAAVGKEFFDSLGKQDIQYKSVLLDGYPTREIIGVFAQEAKAESADLIIGIGGGKALDTAKAVGQQAGLPVVTVPTIAATCAAWSALTVLYTGEGAADGGLLLERSPVLVLADLQVIANSPVRYLRAGIADTIVKWYEYFPSLAVHGREIPLRFEVKIAELALDVLYESSAQAISEAERGIAGKAFSDVVDAVIYLAGSVGSFRSDAFYGEGLAHPFYNGSTHLAKTRSQLHGEKVIFGLLVQLVIEGKSQQEIAKVAGFLGELQLPVTLEQIGISGEEDVELIAVQIEKGLSEHKARKNKPGKHALAKAIFLADEIGRNQQALNRQAV